jgi:hypothetical protein
MVRYDIVSALKNSIARGEDLERAKQILINSGYSFRDVNEAANYLTGGLAGEMQVQQRQAVKQQIPQPQAPNLPPINQNQSQDSRQQNYESRGQNQQIQQLMSSQTNQPKPIYQQPAPIQPLPRLPDVTEYKKPKSGGWLIVILLIILLVLLISSLVLVVLFRDEVTTFIQGIFG